MKDGTSLGPYRVLEKLGEGGMGEVYRANDTKLDRDVALKVVPEDFASDPERLARFQREAKVLASLNHPNIAAIYGLEDSGDTHALVLELVEGPTLQDRIRQGAIPLDEALPIAKQIAEALEAAHEQAIIHRDLKPANIKVTPDGIVKVLDFGLAKALEPERSDEDIANSPTMTHLRRGSDGQAAAATKVGMLLGTAAYMSPEQARGRPVDKRTDIWAFGCVLYEMLTGRPAFGGGDITSILAEVVKFEPDLEALPADLSAATAVAIRRCLVKEPRERFRDIGDVRLAMAGAFDTARPSPVVPSGPRAPIWRRAAAFAGVALLAVVAGGLATRLGMPQAPMRVVRFSLAEARTVRSPWTPDVAISPDGSAIVYVAASGQRRGLRVRWLDEPSSRVLAELELPYGFHLNTPFFSPDGEWVGFFYDGRLMKIRRDGGAVETIVEGLDFPAGASWADDDTIVFSQTLGAAAGLFRVPVGGGEPQRLTMQLGNDSHQWPQTLPGSRAALFSIGAPGVPPSGKVAVVDLDTGEYRVLLERGTNPQYVSTGHLVFEELQQGANANILTIARDAREPTAFLAEPFYEGAPSFSPDGRWMAYVSDETGKWDVYVRSYPDGRGKWLVSGAGGGLEPVWSRDGRELFYRAGSQLWAVPVRTGETFSAGRPELLFDGPYVTRGGSSPNFDAAPDGQRFLLVKRGEALDDDVHVVLNWHQELKARVPTP